MARNYIKLKQIEPTGLASLVRTSQTGDFLTTGNYSGYAENTFYPKANPSGYVRGSQTGLLAGTGGTGWVDTNYVSRSESGTFYPASNPSGYVRASQTGILAGTGTGVGESTGWVNANYYPRTNPSGYYLSSNPSGYVRAVETGILATTGTGSTEGTGWVNANYYPRSNPSGFNNIILVSSTAPTEFSETGNLWLDTTGDCKPVLKAYDTCESGWLPVTTIGQLPLVTFSPFVTPPAAYTYVGSTAEDSFTMTVAGHPNAAIYYTITSGSSISGLSVASPTTGSTRYTSAVSLSNSGDSTLYYLVKAKAFLSYYNSSTVASGVFASTSRYPKVEFTPRNYPSTSLASITLSSPNHDGCKIYYTLLTGERATVDGTASTPSESNYTGQGISPLQIDVSTYQSSSYNIKAIAVDGPSETNPKRSSVVSSASYHAQAYGGNPTLPGITFSPTSNSFQYFPLQVTPSIVGHPLEEGTVFYYTTDGSEPTINSTQIHSDSDNSYVTLTDDGDDDAVVKVFASKYLYAVGNTFTGTYFKQVPQLSPADGSSIRFGTGYSGITVTGPANIFYVIGDPSTGTVPEPIVNPATLEYSGRTQQYTGQIFLDHTFTSGRVIAVGVSSSALTESRTGDYSKRAAATPSLSKSNGAYVSGQGETLTLTATDVDVDFYYTSGDSPSDPTTSDTFVDASNYGSSSTGAFTVYPSTYKFISAGTGLANSAITSATYNEYAGSSNDITFSPVTATTLDFSGTSITVNIANGFSGYATTGLGTPVDPKVTGDSNLENWTPSGSNPAFGLASGDTINLPLTNSTAAATFTVKVISVKDGYQPSPTVASSLYFKKRAASVTIDPLGTISALGESITLSSTDSQPIEFYVETGASGSVSNPTTSSQRYFADYGESLTLNAGDEIRAFAWRSGLRSSAITSTIYSTGQETNQITVSPTSGSSIRFGASGVTFAITAGSSGYFTTGIGSVPEDPIVTGNGSLTQFNPSGANSAQAYSSAVTLPYTNESAQETGYIKYLMVTPGYAPSTVKTATYTKRQATSPTLDPTNGDSVNATGEALSITTTDTNVDFYIESGLTLAATATPTTGSSSYVGDYGSSFNAVPTGDLKVITWGSGLIPSNVVSADYGYATATNALTFIPADYSIEYDFTDQTIFINNIQANSVVFLTTGSQGLLADLENPIVTGNSTYSLFAASGANTAFQYDVDNGLDIPSNDIYKFNIKALVATTGELPSTVSSIQYSNQKTPQIVAQDVSGVTPAYPDGSYDLVQGETFRFRVSGSAGTSPTVVWYKSGSAGETAITNGGYYSITTTTPTSQVSYSILDVTGAADNTKPVYYAKISNSVGTVTGDQTTVKFYDSRIADPTFNVPSGSKIADNGSNFDITTITGGASNALTFVKTDRAVSLASLPDPDGSIVWETGPQGYYGSAFQFFSDTVIKLWSSGVNVARTDVIGLSFETGSFPNRNYFFPTSGLYYDYIDVTIPKADIELWTLDGFDFPRVDLVYNSGVTGGSLTAPTASSYDGRINLYYDSASETLTGRLDTVGDFDIKTLIVEDSTSYGVNFTGEVGASFENRIQFASVSFLKNLDFNAGIVVGDAGPNIIGQNTLLQSINPIKYRSNGSTHIALDADGNLYGYGRNDSYILTNAVDSTIYSSPTLIATDIVDFDCSSHLFVISGASKTLLGRGYNGYGQIGNGSTSSVSDWYNHGGPIKKVACGRFYTLVIDQNDDVLSCGYNDYGQLGRTTISNYSPTFYRASSIPNYSTATDVSCGYDHSAILGSSNDLYLFGQGYYGQLGRGYTTSDSRSSINPQLISNISKVSLGNVHSVVLKTNGDCQTVGYNVYGQLGLGDTSNRYSFVTAATGINDISTSNLSYHTLIQSGYSLFGFGSNSNNQIRTDTTSNQTSPYLMSNALVSGKFGATIFDSFFENSGSRFTYSLDTTNNLATLNYVTGEGGVANPSGATTIAIQLQSLGTEKPINAAIRYTIDGSDPSTGNYAYVIGAVATGVTTGTTNFYFLPETGLTPYGTGTGDLTLKYIAIATGTSTGDISDSFVTTTTIERKTLSPQIKVTYYDDILDTEKVVSGYSATGFSDLFNRDATVEINFSNYDTGSIGALSFYKNAALQSTNTTKTRTLEISAGDNTNTGTLTFSGFASGYRVTGADVTGIFERHQLSSGNFSSSTPSGTYNAPVVYRVYLDNNAANPSDSTIKYTIDGSTPNANSITYNNYISINAAPSPGNSVTIRHKVYKNGYLISEEGPSGTFVIIQQS
jgi:alpha-tubulin suppressor-like RCC1 family protein